MVSTVNNNKPRGVFFPLILGLLTAFGPFITDFYLPVLPEMATFFSSTPALVSMSLTAGMIGLAAGQLFFGPLTDKYGRKLILAGSMLIFTLASIGCILSSNILVFNLFRLLQGLGGAGGIVISKSMASDIYSGRDLMKFMGVLGAINGVAPVVAPMIGGAMAEVASWQGIFVLLLGIGVFLGVGCMRLPETLARERRVTRSLVGTYMNLLRVFRCRAYTRVVLFTVFGAFTFFGYITSSTFILQELYGLSPFGFSLCFGVNALMIGVGAGLAALFKNRIGGIRLAAAMQIAGAAMVGCSLVLHLSVWVLMASYMVMLFAFGLWQPGASSLALDLQRHNSGAASAVFGATFSIAGGLASPLVGLGDIASTTAFVLVGGALLALPLSFLLKNN